MYQIENIYLHLKRNVEFALIDPSYNDAKCGFEMLHVDWLTQDKSRANQIACNINFPHLTS